MSTSGGMPLEGVEVDVYLQPGNAVWGAGTDASGAYEIPSLPAGDYKVLFGYANANSPFAPEWYDDALEEAAADLVHVAEGAVVTGIDGYYVVRGLPPGTYRLQFQDDTQNVGEFWNDKASFDTADDIVLTVGQHRSGVDAVLGTPPGPLPAIVNTQLPIVGGAPIAPQSGYPLTVSRGYWTPGGASVSVQWLVGGQPIPGATSASYKPTLVDLGRPLAVRATASLPGYVPATVTTLPTTPVSNQVQNSVRPRLEGTPKVGGRLKVEPGKWRPPKAVTFTYRWYAD